MFVRLKRLLRYFIDQQSDGARIVEKFSEAELLRAVLNEVDQAVWVDTIDKTRAVLNVGDYEKLYDRPREELKNNPLDWINAIHASDRPDVEAALELQKSNAFDVQYRVVHRDGTIRWLRDRAFLLRDKTGVPAYQAGLVTDITDRVALQEQALHDQKVNAIGTLTGGICHDFNNALAIIVGNLELSLAEDVSDKVRSNLESALAACQRGATLTQRLLAFARKQPLSPSTIKPASLLGRLRELLQQSLSKAIELEFVSAAGVWNCRADSAELETVLLNLAINAQQAITRNGKITIEAFNTRIDEEYARRHEEVAVGQYVCFAVTDNGSGMGEEIIAQAFDPFFTTKQVGEGTGLGLSMAYGFAKQSNGHIKIYSELGAGTTVKLYLPRSVGVEPEFEGQIRLSPENLKGKSVLIVENDEEIRRAVDLMVRAFGCATVQAGTASAALSLVSAGERFDLLLMDVILDGPMNGPQLAKRIESGSQGVRTLFMSGFTENAIIHDGVLDEGIDLLQKPFTRDQLLMGMLKALG